MKTFVIFFKSGAKFAIEAHGWTSDSTGFITFQGAEGQPSNDIYVNSLEVLYITPVELVREVPLWVK
jgi:hypothetical protein